MPTIKFAGRTLPAVIQITIKDHPTVRWHDDEIGVDINFTISIHEGVVTVECELTDFQKERDLVRVYMRAFDLVRATVDLTCFSTGYGLSVIIDSFTDTDGVTTPFVSHAPKLGALCTAFNMNPASTIEKNVFHKVLVLVLTDWHIFRILRQPITSSKAGGLIGNRQRRF